MLRFRQLWLNIHLWLGVGLFIVLVPLGVSGAILVWDQPLEHALQTDRFAVSVSKPALAPSVYVDAAQHAFAGRAQVVSLRLPADAGVPVTVVGQMPGPPGPNGRPRQLTARLDPATARVTDTAEVARSGFSVIHRLHGSLLVPGVGRKIVGWLGWAMTISSLTGLILWWPRKGALLNGLRWTRTPMVFDNLHHLIGFWVCVPLAVLSLTGVYVAFPQTARAVFGQAQATAPQRLRTPEAPLAQTSRIIDAAVAAAQASAPGPITSVTFPTAGRAPSWRVEMGGRSVRVVDATGEVKPDRDRPSGRAGQDGISRLMRQVHDGSDTGPVWQTIIVLAGLAPALLGLTGVVMWARRQLRKRALITT